jgi:Zyg-11 family protein
MFHFRKMFHFPFSIFAAAKISTQETSRLGSQSRYMNKLLSIVRKKVTDRALDVTLKFSLSALWNLTDESPQTCDVFLQEGGMQLFLQVGRSALAC